jgi:outer membrane protein assembly factor BamB
VSGVLTVGRRDGRVVAHDYLTGTRLWEYEADEAVMATSASLGRQVFVVSHGHLHILDSSGVLIRKLALPDATYELGPGPGASVASPALTANLVYVSSTGGFVAATFDLSSYVVDTNAPGGLSSPAVGQDGTLYMVTTSGSLRAYRGP